MYMYETPIYTYTKIADYSTGYNSTVKVYSGNPLNYLSLLFYEFIWPFYIRHFHIKYTKVNVFFRHGTGTHAS